MLAALFAAALALGNLNVIVHLGLPPFGQPRLRSRTVGRSMKNATVPSDDAEACPVEALRFFADAKYFGVEKKMARSTSSVVRAARGSAEEI